MIQSNLSSEWEAPHLTDLGNCKRLVREYGDDLRYVWPWKKWLAWDGSRWTDDPSYAYELAKQTVLNIYAEVAQVSNADDRKMLVKHARESEAAARIDALLKLARSESGIPLDPDALDQPAFLLNCANGTVDLTTGRVREHSRADLLTKLCPTPFDPRAECPVWLQFLNTIFANNQELIGYVQRLLGYGLTGNVSEQILPIFWGTGANGKSTLLNAIQDMLGGDYAMKAPLDLLMQKRGDSHPTERADLFGRRFVCCIETEDGRRLAESLVKELTGGDRIRARRMREDFWEFLPTHKIILCTNHQPVVQGTDYAIWRRLRLVPLTVTIPEHQQDKQLPEKLRNELPGILRWCVQGCLDWQKHGLRDPQVVINATRQYRDSQDLIGQFLAEHCIEGGSIKVRGSDLYVAYQRWAEVAGERAIDRRAFGVAMTERGYERYTNNGTCYRGVGLRG